MCTVRNSHIHVASARNLPSHILHSVMSVADIAWTYLHSWAKHTMIRFKEIHQTATGSEEEWQELPPHSFSQKTRAALYGMFLTYAKRRWCRVDGIKSVCFWVSVTCDKARGMVAFPCQRSCWYAPHEPTNVLVQAGANRVQSRTAPNNRSGWQGRDSPHQRCVTCPPENADRTYGALGWHVFARRHAV